MSYDILIFSVDEGMTPEECFESKCCSHDDKGERFTKDSRQVVRDILGSIEATFPALRPSPSEVTEELRDRESGLQVVFFAKDSGAISFPYWHSGKDFIPVLRGITEALRVFGRSGEYWAFDPQLDIYVNVSNPADLSDYVERLSDSNEKTVKMLRNWFR